MHKSQGSWKNFGCVHTLPWQNRKFPWRKHNILSACNDRRIHHPTLFQTELLKLAERQCFLRQSGRCCSSEYNFLAATAYKGCSLALPGWLGEELLLWRRFPASTAHLFIEWLLTRARFSSKSSQLQEWLGAKTCFPGGTQDVFIHSLHHGLLFLSLSIIWKSGTKHAWYELQLLNQQWSCLTLKMCLLWVLYLVLRFCLLGVTQI